MALARLFHRAWRAAIVVTLVIAPACRKDNPSWLGPASADGMSSDDGTSGGDESTSAVASEGSTGMGSTGMGSTDTASTGLDPSTTGSSSDEGGKTCHNNNQCDGEQVCGPDDTCQDGVLGDPCANDSQCTETAPFCGPAGTCQVGGAGDPCEDEGDCARVAPTCAAKVCAPA